MTVRTNNYGWALLFVAVILILLNTIGEAKNMFGVTGMTTMAFESTASQFAIVTIGVVFLIAAAVLVRQNFKKR